MITLSKHILFSFILCLLFSPLQGQTDPNKGFLKIKNDIFWDTQEGDPLYSQGGGIFSFKDPEDGQTKYFWYGAKYQESEKYRNDPSVTPERDNFVSVTCYVSTDLVNWTSHGDVLTLDELNKILSRRAGQDV
ncbi:hypothetical protein [Sphingobacterium sp.]|uniref:hypothetical protein n=1 Tax=Sphingobacterium sp. TaxID=341027 RepID=UPI002FDCF314